MPSGKLNQRQEVETRDNNGRAQINCKIDLFKNEESVLHSSAVSRNPEIAQSMY